MRTLLFGGSTGREIENPERNNERSFFFIVNGEADLMIA
jgi:hypothetical protein